MKNWKSVILALLVLAMLPLGGVFAEEPVTLSIMKASSIDVWRDDDPALVKIQEETNTHLVLDSVDDITQSLNLAVASGEMDDIMVAPRFTYLDYIDSGSILELSGLLAEYGPNIMANISEQAWEMTRVGDQIYGIPFENFNSKYVTALRKDWLENLGIEIKSDYTLDELMEILRAFTLSDPDGNGEQDTYGFSTIGLGSSWNLSFMPIFGAFGGQPNQYYLQDDQFVPFNLSDGFRDSLEYLATCWQEGLIDPEIFILNADQATQKIVNSVSGAYSSWWSGPKTAFENGIADLTPGADFQKVFITSNDGTTTGMVDNGLIANVTLISADCEHPEAAIQLLDYMTSDEGYMLSGFGLEGYHYELDDNGYMTNIFDMQRNWVPLTGIIRRPDIAAFHDSMPLAEGSDYMLQTIWDFQMIQYDLDLPLYTSIFYGINTTREEQEYGTDLANYVTQMVVEFVTGETELNDESWSLYKQNWSQKGGQKILDSYAEAYNALKDTTYQAITVE